LSDTQEPPRLPVSPVVWALVGAIVLSYAAFTLAPPATQDALVYQFALIPVRFDASSADHFTNWYGYLEPIFGHVFLHSGWWHAGLNAFFFFLTARLPALRLGAWRFLTLFFFSAVCGALAYLALNWGTEHVAVGASGAVCGVFTAYYLAARRTWRQALADPEVRNPLAMVVFFNVVVMGAASAAGFIQIAWEAHLGGFVGGALAYIALERRAPRGPWS
jgi:membrane associated rhomboid family serine protease